MGTETGYRDRKMDRNSIISKFVSSCFDVKSSNSKLFYSNKAISPVVATALLLVVAVVAVVGFQSWFGSYSSGVFSDIEIQSNSALDSTLKIESLIGDILYIINNIQDNLSITTLKIGGNLCTITDNLTLGMNEVPVSSCVSNLTTSTPDIVLITEKNVVSKTVYVKDSVSSSSSSLDCSILNGGEWVLVPGASEFCVMKYEAKFYDYTGKANTDSYNTWNWGTATGDMNITSSATGGPIAYINQTDAELACQSLGANYHLISDAQWVTIARNAELQESNWDSGTVYSGSMMRGHADGTPFAALSVSNINDPYDQTGQSSPSIERRTLNLSNGEVIWDIGGNVWEWTSDSLPTTGVQNSSLGLGDGWKQWNTVNSINYGYLMPLNTSLTSTNGIGQVYTDSGTASDGGDVHAFLRGGFWLNGANAGAFALGLDYGPSSSLAVIGFRCSYAP